jgi:hypothetical protein
MPPRREMHPRARGPESGLVLRLAQVLKAREAAGAAFAPSRVREPGSVQERAVAELALALELAPALLPPEEDATRLPPARELEPGSGQARESPPGPAAELEQVQVPELVQALQLVPAEAAERVPALAREPRFASEQGSPEAAPQASESPELAPAARLGPVFAPLLVHHPAIARAPRPPPVLRRPSPPIAIRVAAWPHATPIYAPIQRLVD